LRCCTRIILWGEEEERPVMKREYLSCPAAGSTYSILCARLSWLVITDKGRVHGEGGGVIRAMCSVCAAQIYRKEAPRIGVEKAVSAHSFSCLHARFPSLRPIPLRGTKHHVPFSQSLLITRRRFGAPRQHWGGRLEGWCSSKPTPVRTSKVPSHQFHLFAII
jgi:hypothetical protein